MRSNSAAQVNLESSSASRAQGLATVLDATARQARDTLRLQAAAVAAVGDRLDDRFAEAVRLLHGTKGHVIVTGLGKSGHIGRKMAATFASTGTPSFFVHTTEALHGDLGMVTPEDAVLLISYSGETIELLQLLPHLRARRVRTVALVGAVSSSLANGVDVALDVSVDREVCPNNLAPTCSTLAALAMGDTLAVSLMRMRSFHEEDFARLHPGGSLGRRLSRAIDVAIREDLVILAPDVAVSECVLALAGSEHSVALVRDTDGIVGMVTPVELQRALTRVEGAMQAPVREIMNRVLPVVDADTLVVEAEARMEREGSAAMIVLADDGELGGLLLRSRKR
jgi:arabinose-5-phosphate isomerase